MVIFNQMQFFMSTIRHNSKVRNGIIKFVFIYMVNMFVAFKFSPKIFFHNISVFSYLTTIGPYLLIPRFVDISIFPMRIIFTKTRLLPKLTHTFSRAKKIIVSVYFRWWSSYTLIANSTVSFRSGFSKGISSCFSHIFSSINKIGRAVVHESRSFHSTPINRKSFGHFVNTYSIT